MAEAMSFQAPPMLNQAVVMPFMLRGMPASPAGAAGPQQPLPYCDNGAGKTPTASPAVFWPATPEPEHLFAMPVGMPMGLDAMMAGCGAYMQMSHGAQVFQPVPALAPVAIALVPASQEQHQQFDQAGVLLAVAPQHPTFFQAMPAQEFVYWRTADGFAKAEARSQVSTEEDKSAEPSGDESTSVTGWQSGPTASKGSVLHDGQAYCRPCAWYWKPRGCSAGGLCDYCHMCPEGELKNRKKLKVACLRMAEKAEKDSKAKAK